MGSDSSKTKARRPTARRAKPPLSLEEHLTRLRESYQEHFGYIRVKMEHRRAGVRMGWEIRLLGKDTHEAIQLGISLRAVGLRPGAMFRKRRKWVVPLYGHEQVQQFLKMTRPLTKYAIPNFENGVDMRFKPG